MSSISVAEAKSHFSELIAKASHRHERVVITRHNKPVAALVSVEDLQILEQHRERQGLATVAGKWHGFGEVIESLGDLATLRKDTGRHRDVSL